MKALILAAGFGTRLLPYTEQVPKPLFPLSGKPVLEMTIQNLIKAGFNDIYINTHHLSGQIQNFIDGRNYDVKVQTVYEPKILDTGGAVLNLKRYLENEPFMVINSDVVTTIDLKKVYDFHFTGQWLTTLVLHNYEQFNKIHIDSNGFIIDFKAIDANLAFTGIQVLSPEIFKHMPNEPIFSSIDLYQQLLAEKNVKAFISKNHYWTDIGTIKSYKKASLEHIVLTANQAPLKDINSIKIEKITGDGSDRQYYRSFHKKKSHVICDHGLEPKIDNQPTQMDSFIHIGNHLHEKGLPVPKILGYDKFAGLVVLEDLGHTHLENTIHSLSSQDDIISWYMKILDSLFDLSQKGCIGFSPEWTYQTKSYSIEMILENECRYFVDEFINGYLNKKIDFKDYLTEFQWIAENTSKYGFMGLMHRDMQSRNIMIKDDRHYFIDFQGARTGPFQYDVASLLIDPYVELDQKIIDTLIDYVCRKLEEHPNVDKESFLHSFYYCCITRNLQFLGAFSFLSRKKNKKFFEKYIPYAVKTLKKSIELIDKKNITKLHKLINDL